MSSEHSYLDAVRTAYDTVAVSYAAMLKNLMAEMACDRAVLGLFAELVNATGNNVVGDLGCGPGRVTVHLDSLGCNAFGIDLSPAMVEVAREAYPHLRFEVGSITNLDLADGSLGGIAAWYSVIHTPPELLPTVFAEFHRVLVPGGQAVLAFQIGDELRHIEQAYGHDISLDAYRRSPDIVATLLEKAGLAVHTRLVREPLEQEKTQQGYLIAAKH